MTKELAARVAEWRDALSRSGWLAREALASKCVTDLAEFLDEVERLDAERDQALAVAQAVGSQMTDLARQLGELQGKASIMEHVHLLDDWREKCEAQAVQNDALQQENVTLGICCDKAVKERDEAKASLAWSFHERLAAERDATLAREAKLRATLEIIVVQSENPLSRPLEVGSRHSPITRQEGLARYSETCAAIHADARAALKTED